MNKQPRRAADGYEVLVVILLGIILLVKLEPTNPSQPVISPILAVLVIVLMTASVCQWFYSRDH